MRGQEEKMNAVIKISEHELADERDRYTVQPCHACQEPHDVPNWHKPFKNYCEKNGCRQLRVEKFVGMDSEIDDNEEIA